MLSVIDMWYLMELIRLYSGLVFYFLVSVVLPAMAFLWFLNEFLEFKRKVAIEDRERKLIR